MATMDAKALRELAAGYMKSRKGKNSYTQGGNRVYFFGKPDNEPGNTTQRGYSDCSSAVRASIRAAAGIDIGSNTSAQINNRGKGAVVDQTDGYYPDESRLQPGDCLYFKGNTGHPMDVGHVEMYTGSNECYGHGSGTGPTATTAGAGRAAVNGTLWPSAGSRTARRARLTSKTARWATGCSNTARR